MAKGKKPCKSELGQLAGTLGHLHRIQTCSTAKELKAAIGDHTYEQLSCNEKDPIFHNVRADCIQRMRKSVEFQRGDIKWKLELLGYKSPEDLSPRDGLAAYCLMAT